MGGGTRQFEDFVREKGEFEIESLKVISHGEIQQSSVNSPYLFSETSSQKHMFGFSLLFKLIFYLILKGVGNFACDPPKKLLI